MFPPVTAMKMGDSRVIHFPGLLRLVAFVMIAVGFSQAIQAEDWPRFLGPRGDGTSTETGLLDRWSEAGPPKLWAKNVGAGYSAPSVRDGKLVLHHRTGEEEIVECFDSATGTPRWRHAYPSRFQDPYGYSTGPRGTPLLTTNRCYTFGPEGKLVCLDLATGKLVWQRDTARDWQVPEAFFGVGSTPLLEGEKLIVMIGGQPNSGVAALDAATGRTLWENAGQSNWNGLVTIGWRAEAPYRWTGVEKQASYASPIATTIHGQRHLLCFMRQGLVSLNPTNGAVNFSRWFQSSANDSVNAMNPVVQDDLILLSAAYYRVGAVLLRVKPDGKSFEEVWRIPKHPLDPEDRDQATGRWNRPPLEIHWNTPILHDGYLYAFSGRNEPDARFRCVELKTGTVAWDRDESWPPHSTPTPGVYGRGSAILADGRLIVLGEGGLLGMFAVDSKQPRELARWQVPELKHPCWAAPVLANKRLYLRSEGHLVCLDMARK